MNIFNNFEREIETIVQSLSDAGVLPRGLDTTAITVEPPRDPAHGDLASNAALALARNAGMEPREIAGRIAERLGRHEAVAAVEVAGPGFINLRLTDAFWRDRLAEVLLAGSAYGASDLGRGERVNVEYVSTNPTGPLHVGHARGAVFGDALAALLEKAGYDVTREFYINDSGAQVDALARSLRRRYLVAIGAESQASFEASREKGEVEYGGDYLRPVAETLARRDGDAWRDADESDWLPAIRDFAIAEMMALVREDLAALGVHHDVFTSERGLVESGRLEQALDRLESGGMIYTGVLEPPKGKTPEDWEPRAQTLFRSTGFGDDVDRPLKKSDGSWTYFAPDIANHLDKIERGATALIDVWGADHGGYVKRMKAAVAALTGGDVALDVKLCQMVRLLRRGEPVKMSKRAGRFVTVSEVIDEVGKDVVRFIMLTRKNDAPLDFDLSRVTEQSKDNPVFYVQYAHARVCSVMRNAAAEFAGIDTDPGALAGAALDRLDHPAELALIKTLAAWPRQVESAAEAHEPHRLAFYLADLAAAFHGLWALGNEDQGLRFIVAGDEALTRARLALVRAVGLVIASALDIFGVEPVEEMR
ncbi:MAG: arginine--tRNA ligase [Proteobacteria bacterium]|nr:arginine--tRNA ligase [Pseudomonadota bacterium]